MTSLLSAASPQTVELRSDWRTELTHRGKYWHYRRGSGSTREYMRGGRSEMLPTERLEAHKHNVKRKKTKHATRSESYFGDSKEHLVKVATGRTDILDS